LSNLALRRVLKVVLKVSSQLLPATSGLVLSFAMLSASHAQGTAGNPSVPMSFTLGFETLKLPQNEHMGVLGGSLLFEAAPGWWLGPGVYGAATGQRGGFFVGGAELQKRWALGNHLTATTGFFVGGGGGGGAPVGGGLMLRPSASLLWDFGSWQTGPTVSRVSFPNGEIGSTQFGWMVGFSDRFAFRDWRRTGQPALASDRSGVGFDRIGLVLGSYRLTDDSLGHAAPGASRSTDYVGARADHWLTPKFYASLEAAGAAQGGADGYAEVLGGLGVEMPLSAIGLSSVSVGARTALGLGGGGAVQTGGGVIGKLAGTLTWNLGRDAYLAAEGGYVDAPDGQFRARYAQLTLGMTLDHPFDVPRGTNAPATISHNEWALSLQHATRAARKTGGEESLDTIGVKFNRYLGTNLYVTGQWHNAYAGNAGAYALGLVGAGLAVPLTSSRSPWVAGAEVLVGAAGGGGVDTQGGGVAQGLLWLGFRATRNGQIKVGVGQVRSIRGGLSSPLVDLSWSQSFGLAGR
jgi:hypothetical protein